MSRFLRLTNLDGSFVLVNSEAIEHIDARPDQHARIWFRTQNRYGEVLESLDEIAQKLDRAGHSYLAAER